MSSRPGHALVTGVRVAVVVLLAASLPALAQLDQKGVFGTVKDHEGNPLAGVKVTATAIENEGTAPLTVKTTKKGRFIFPFFHQEQKGWNLQAQLEGYRLYKFHFLSRNAQRILIQDDTGTLGPEGTPPFLDFRDFGFAEIELEMIPEDMMPHQAAPAGGATDGLPGIGLEGDDQVAPGLSPEEKALHEARERARTALEEGEVDTAVTALEEILAQNPDDQEVRLVLAKTLRMVGDDGAALRHLSKLTRMAPQQKGIHVLMGDLQMDLGRSDQAQASYAVERTLVGDDPEILQKLAQAAAENSDRTTLLETYEAWAGVAPRDPQPLVALGTAYAEEGDFARSEELFRRAAELDPHAADVLFFNVGASILNRRPVTTEGRKQAAAAFRKVLEHNPKHSGAHFRLALTLIGLGEMGAAREHLQSYLELDPKGAESQNARELLDSLK